MCRHGSQSRECDSAIRAVHLAGRNPPDRGRKYGCYRRDRGRDQCPVQDESGCCWLELDTGAARSKARPSHPAGPCCSRSIFVCGAWASLQLYQDHSLLTAVPTVTIRFYCGGSGCAQLVFHFHRLHHQNALTCRYCIADSDVDPHDESRHRRNNRLVPPVARSARRAPVSHEPARQAPRYDSDARQCRVRSGPFPRVRAPRHARRDHQFLSCGLAFRLRRPASQPRQRHPARQRFCL